MNKEKFLKITICSIVLVCTIVALFYYTIYYNYNKDIGNYIKCMFNTEYTIQIGKQPVDVEDPEGNLHNFGICSYVQTDCKMVPLRCLFIDRKTHNPKKKFAVTKIQFIIDTEDTELIKNELKECEVK